MCIDSERAIAFYGWNERRKTGARLLFSEKWTNSTSVRCCTCIKIKHKYTIQLKDIHNSTFSFSFYFVLIFFPHFLSFSIFFFFIFSSYSVQLQFSIGNFLFHSPSRKVIFVLYIVFKKYLYMPRALVGRK